MDAGVPIKAPVGGIAMGLVKEGDDYVILTDIQGAEDHLGDMDFKVAGTRDGITALQMDIKITGVTQEIMSNALEQAKQARDLHPRQDGRGDLRRAARSSPHHAPRISSVKIDPEKIGMVIGKGGETIRSLEADYEVQIDIEEDGTILIYATEGEKADAAIAAIESLTKEPEVGDTYTGKVVKTTQFGAFVELKKGTDGLLHVSNVGPGRVGHIEDVIGRGDVLDVVVAGGGQGAWPDRPQARRQARERQPRPARGADRAGEGRPAAAAGGSSSAPRRRAWARRSRRRRPWQRRRSRPLAAKRSASQATASALDARRHRCPCSAGGRGPGARGPLAAGRDRVGRGASRPGEWLRRAVEGYELWIVFLVSAIATGGSLFFSEIAGFVPCELCWFQRICMYPLSIVTLLAALANDRRVARYLLPLPAGGRGRLGLPPAGGERRGQADAGVPDLGAGGCATKWIEEFGYVTIPALALTGFALCFAFLLLAALARSDGYRV